MRCSRTAAGGERRGLLVGQQSEHRPAFPIARRWVLNPTEGGPRRAPPALCVPGNIAVAERVGARMT